METVLALFVLTIGIMGVFALFPAGLTASRDAMHDSRISLLAEAVMADLRRELAENFDPNAGGYKFEDDDNFTGTIDANSSRPQLIEDLNTGTPIGRFKLTVQPNTEFASGKLAEAMLECWPGPGELSGPTLERQRRLVFYTRILDRSE
jgi:hypothetical protein